MGNATRHGWGAAGLGALWLALAALLASASPVLACTSENAPMALASVEHQATLVVEGVVTATTSNDQAGTVGLTVRVRRVLKGTSAGTTATFYDVGECPITVDVVVGSRVIVAGAADGAVVDGWARGPGGAAYPTYHTTPELTTWAGVIAAFSAPDTSTVAPSAGLVDVSPELLLLLTVGLTSLVVVLRHGRRTASPPRI
jgi:hypothetical protein